MLTVFGSIIAVLLFIFVVTHWEGFLLLLAVGVYCVIKYGGRFLWFLITLPFQIIIAPFRFIRWAVYKFTGGIYLTVEDLWSGDTSVRLAKLFVVVAALALLIHYLVK